MVSALKKLSFQILFVTILSVAASCTPLEGVFTKTPQSSRHASAFGNKRFGADADDARAARPPIVTAQGTYYFVKPGDTLERISDRVHMDWEHIAQINNLYDSDLVVGRRLFIPNKKTMDRYVVVSRVIYQDRSKEVGGKKLEFIWPIPGARVSSLFGFRRGRPHSGIDISAKVGTPIFAVEQGRVLYAKRFTTYGNLVVIKHANNYYSAYAHNSNIFVSEGQNVKKGQRISLVGMTGRTYGAHLHFEIHQNRKAIDPMPLLPKK